MSVGKRKNNWWEPIYIGDDPKFAEHNWDFTHADSAVNSSFKPDKVKAFHYPNITFRNCDFEGDFKSGLNERSIRFVGCTFEKCDFGYSIWKFATFTGCTFVDSSFTVSTFEDCEFRDCKFSSIAFLGNKTTLTRTLITNPGDFLRAAALCKDYLPKEISIRYQRARLIETRSTLSRSILANLANEGSEKTYYDGIRATTLLAARARHVPALMKFYGKEKKASTSHFAQWKNSLWLAWSIALWTSGLIEWLLLWCLGLMNAWGASVVRTLAFGIAFLAIFSVGYHLVLQDPMQEAAIKSFEVFFLFGYTNFTTDAEIGSCERYLLMANAMFGIIWYVVNVPTIVNKLTRIR